MDPFVPSFTFDVYGRLVLGCHTLVDGMVVFKNNGITRITITY